MSVPPPGGAPGRRAVRVTANEPLGDYNVLRVSDPQMDGVAPGQFAMLAAVERWGAGADERPFLARAFSIARHARGESSYLLEDVGPGTRRLCELDAGDELWVLGPLGQGFTAPEPDDALDRPRRAILVGGGVGIAPLAILQDMLDGAQHGDGDSDGDAGGGRDGDRGGVGAGVRAVTVLLGFRDEARVPGASLLRDAELASDDGSAGHHGLVTDLLERELRADSHASVYACGPAGMLEGVRAICERERVPAQLALEAGMACGFGACYGCAVPTRAGGYVRVCVDGPVLDAATLERVELHAGAPE